MSQSKKKPWWKQINLEWLPEIIACTILAIFAIYLVIPSSVKASFWTNLQPFFTGLGVMIQAVVTPPTLLILLGIIVAIYLFVKRLRYHLFRLASDRFKCPVCQHKVQKKHRKSYERLLSRMIPVRRYYCSNCGWEGLRVHPKRRRSSKRKPKE